ncbi:MAG: hypothetical protein NDJ75_11695 [Thermoanaerobaculia bacterium]|nr:hypothetical protein [Thermoanaerobaculia bacterium]
MSPALSPPPEPRSDAPALSAALASLRPRAVAEPALQALARQCEALGAELVVARRPLAADESWLGQVAPAARVVRCPADADVPRLRGAALAAARGEWVALTEDCCVAAPDWLQRIAEATASDREMVGGVVRNGSTARALDWGAYFSDWGFYGEARSVAGRPPVATCANVAYRRPLVARLARWASEGAWENVLHERLHAAGGRYAAAPAAVVRHHLTHRFAAVLGDRFAHGRDFARARSGGLGRGARGLRALLAPALPPLLAWRVWRSSGRQTPIAYARAFAHTLAFLAAWSCGEAVGYLRGAPRR